jgi:hypothetical protein
LEVSTAGVKFFLSFLFIIDLVILRRLLLVVLPADDYWGTAIEVDLHSWVALVRNGGRGLAVMINCLVGQNSHFLLNLHRVVSDVVKISPD